MACFRQSWYCTEEMIIWACVMVCLHQSVSRWQYTVCVCVSKNDLLLQVHQRHKQWKYYTVNNKTSICLSLSLSLNTHRRWSESLSLSESLFTFVSLCSLFFFVSLMKSLMCVCCGLLTLIRWKCVWFKLVHMTSVTFDPHTDRQTNTHTVYK